MGLTIQVVMLILLLVVVVLIATISNVFIILNKDKKYVKQLKSSDEFIEENADWLKKFVFSANFDVDHFKQKLKEAGKKENLDDFIKFLKDKNIQIVRMGIFFNNCPNGDILYYKEYLEKFTEAQIQLILCPGIKAPRWPEIHIDENVINRLYRFRLPKTGHVLKKDDPLAIYALSLQKEIYTNLDSLRIPVFAIQPENEPFKMFGEYKWLISKELLLEEFKLAKSKFPNSRLMVNCSIEFNQLKYTYKFLEEFRKNNIGTRCILGFNFYTEVPKNLKDRISVILNNLVKRGNDIGSLKEYARKFEIQVSEFQFEPWYCESEDKNLLEPGNNWRQFAKSLIYLARFTGGEGRKRKYFLKNMLNDRDKTIDVSLWGIEEFYSKKKTNNHKEIENIIKFINS